MSAIDAREVSAHLRRWAGEDGGEDEFGRPRRQVVDPFTLPASSPAGSSPRTVYDSPVSPTDKAIGVAFSADDEQPAASYRAPIDQNTRWSQTYSHSLRTRSSLVRANSLSAQAASRDQQPATPTPQAGYDASWQPVDERDEAELTSDDDDTDLDLGDDDLDDLDDPDREEERTAAIVVAEEGRGLIVRGDGIATVKLRVEPGTTHLLVGSSSTPNAIPGFLTQTLPMIAHSLLALDISCNFLGALPPALEACAQLEELNISSNPIRALPLFVASLTSLRVLIADSTGIATLPGPLAALEHLHTLSIRRNKMHALPIWLCLLPALETLLVDGNPFQGPWKALVDPLLAREASPQALYPPSTPIHPPPSAATTVSYDHSSDDHDDQAAYLGLDRSEPDDEEHTIMPTRASLVGRAPEPAPPIPPPPPPPRSPGLTRTRTTPGRGYFDRDRHSRGDDEPAPGPRAVSQHESSHAGGGEGQVRRMKSAGELRGRRAASTAPASPVTTPPALPSPPRSRPATNYASGSGSTTNLLGAPEPLPPRFASLGATNSLSAANARARPPLRDGLFSGAPPVSAAASEFPASASSSRPPSPPPSAPPGGPGVFSKPGSPEAADKRARAGPPLAGAGKKDKAKWGFLRKMSMGKLKAEAQAPQMQQPRPPPPAQAASAMVLPRPGLAPLAGTAVEPRSASSPLLSRPPPGAHAPSMIDVRLSSTGALNFEMPAFDASNLPPSIVEPDEEGGEERGEGDDGVGSAPNTATPPLGGGNGFLGGSLLVPPASPTSRRAKRRSFLPIDGASALTIPVPSPSAFVSGFAVNAEGGADERARTPSPTPADRARVEEERAREAYTRALRSVMAYLRDMNDLSVPALVPGTPGEGSRSRRPTLSEGRANSEASSGGGTPVLSTGGLGLTNGAGGGGGEQLRSVESMSRLRSVSSSQTASVMSTDSSGSGGGEGRKFKDDGGKRALILREIVETERTYVKGLQELVDIYVKPGAAPVNVLGASTRETVVPAQERRIVFGGLDSLFSFHRESFLPALEHAAGAVLRMRAPASEDADGRLSLTAAVAVANVFVGHAAFMRMYSTYINNFDNAVDRIKSWTTDRPSAAAGASSPGAPAGGGAQVVGVGLSTNVSEAAAMAPLGASTRKRIKQYLKRARLSPRHSQLNLEGYLLLPVQRIPRYKLLLEQLGSSTPPAAPEHADPLDKASAEIAALAADMNEGKREAEGRRRLVQWQARIRGRFPSPLVQPHRRLIMDGPLLLTRVVRKVAIAFEVITPQGDAADVLVECLAPEQTPRSLVGILCNDLLVLCRDASEGKEAGSAVDLWAVLRMQTLPQPASIVHGNVLRLVDNKAILYFEASSTSDALTWFRAINLHIPSKS